MKKTLIAISVAGAALFAPAEYINDAEFTYRAPVTFPGYTIADDTQENFPVLVRLTETEGGFSYASASDDGSDIRFTLADGTILASEVSLWDPNGESLVWVSVPELAVGTEIYLYWGGSHSFPASQTDGSVWTNAGYFAVWHMDEDSTTTIAKDSAGGAMEGTHVNTMPGQSDAKLGRSVRISNAGWNVAENKGIRTAAYSDVGSEFVFTLWAKYPNQDVGNDRLGSHKTSWDGTSGWEISGRRYNANSLDFRGASGTSAEAEASMKNMGWSHMAFVFEANNKGTFYLNNSWKSSKGLTAATDNDVVLVLGNEANLTGVSFKGWMDEVRLHKGGMTRNWLSTEYNSVNNVGFAAVGAAETITSSGDVPLMGAVSVSATNQHDATISWTLRTASSSSSATVTAYYGTDPDNLSQSLVLASGADIATGAHTSSLTGLACASTWYAKVVATGGDGNGESETVSFATTGTPVFGDVSYSLDGLAVTITGSLTDAGSVPLDVSALFGADTATWTPVDSWSGVTAPRSFEASTAAPSLGDYAAGFRATGTCTDCGHVFDITSSVAVVSISGECRWTGAAGTYSWNTPGNWSSGTVPASKDTVVFGAEASVSGATISLDGAQTVGSLVVESAGTLAIGSADDVTEGYTLSAAHLSRSSANADTLSFAIPFSFSEPEDGTNTLVAAADVRFGAGIGATASRPLVKTGAGTVTLAGAISGSHPMIWVREGQVSATAANSIRGNTWVGGGTEAATLVFTRDDVVAGSGAGNLIVQTNGTATLRGLPWGHFYDRMNAYDGGYISCNDGAFTLRATLRGSTIRCGGTIQTSGYWGQGVESLASDQTSYFRANMTLNPSDSGNPAYITVADGEAPVDLVMTGYFRWNGSSSKSIRKNGDGVMKMTSASGPASSAPFQLSAGTLLCDNESGSPIGNTALSVGAGATLGGIGFVGGTERGNVIVAGTAAKPGVLAPGSIDEETGARIHGTFTIGSTTQTNLVSLGDSTKLAIGIGSKKGMAGKPNFNKLKVNGDLSIGDNCTLDLTANSAELDEIKGGRYTIVEADKIEGAFATVIKPKNSWKVTYVSEEVEGVMTVRQVNLDVPFKGFALIVK